MFGQISSRPHEPTFLALNFGSFLEGEMGPRLFQKNLGRWNIIPFGQMRLKFQKWILQEIEKLIMVEVEKGW